VRKTLASAGIALAVIGASAAAGTAHASQPGIQAGRADRATALARGAEALAAHRSAIDGTAAEKYIARDVIVDASGATHVRYDRTYQGLAVRGGDFVVHNTPGGSFAGATVAQSAPISLASTAPSVASATAAATAAKAFGGTVRETGAPQLVVDASAGAGTLAWSVTVSGVKANSPSRIAVLVDAKSGAVLSRNELIRTLAVPGIHAASAPALATAQGAHAIAGSGTGVFNGTVPVDTTAAGTGFTLTDPTRGNGKTCDGQQKDTGTCVDLTDADNIWGDGKATNRQSAAVDAHYGAAKTYDYYNAVLGRNGIFGNGTGAPSIVHYGNAIQNAFWDGTQMLYGDGLQNTHPLVALDVAGHEMTHGVTERTANLDYFGDAGGLNEASSDIVGTMVEYYAANPKDTGDYDIGDTINIFGNGKPLRYMYEPFLDGSSPNCWTTGIKNLDPHYSSGIGNHFYYLLAEGSAAGPHKSPTCGAPAVTGIGRDKAAKLYYKALSTYYVHNTDYPKARTATLQAAADLYGKCGTEYKAVQSAWSATGVVGTDACTTPPTGKYFENAKDIAIKDKKTVISQIKVAGVTGNAPAALAVKVDIKHTNIGTLVVDLLAPDGSVYNLHNRTGGTADNISKTYTVDASSEVANGTWKLRVSDKAAGDTGKIDLWGLQF
jgi:Zn-dependent metalloprotease